MRVLMVFCLFVHLNYCNAQIKEIENENFKGILKSSLISELIFKSDSSRKVLKTRDINPFLKIGLPFKEGYNENSNPCWMSFDSSIHHCTMIDTFLNHKISKADISTSTLTHIFSKYVISSYSIHIQLGDWSKTLNSGGKIFDKNGIVLFKSINTPNNGIQLWNALIDDSGKYLATIRSDHFEESEFGYLDPLDFFIDIYSFPNMIRIFSEQIPKDFTLHLHKDIFWTVYPETDNSRLNRPIGSYYSFYALEKNKCFNLYLSSPFTFIGSREDKFWLEDGIILRNTSDETKVIKKYFDRDFKVKEIIKK